MALSLFRSQRVRAARPSRNAPRKSVFLPRVEQLEERRVPTLIPAVYWEGYDDRLPDAAEISLAADETFLVDTFNADTFDASVLETTVEVAQFTGNDLLRGIDDVGTLQFPLVAPQLGEGEALTIAGIELHGLAIEVADLVLEVQQGILSISAANAEAVIQDNHSAQVSLYGTVAGVNAVLATLVYRPDAGFRGLDTLEGTARLEDGTEQTRSLPIFVRAVAPASSAVTTFATDTTVLPVAVSRATPVYEPAADKFVAPRQIDTGGVGGPLPARAPEASENASNVRGEPVREEPVESRSFRLNLESLLRLIDWRRPAPEPEPVPEPPEQGPQSRLWDFEDETFSEKERPAFAFVDYPCESNVGTEAVAGAGSCGVLFAGIALGSAVEPHQRKRKRKRLSLR